MTVRMSVDGVPDAVAIFRNTPGAIRTELSQRIRVAAEIILSEGKGRVPYDDGDLFRSLDMLMKENALVATVGTDLLYGKFVELGTLRTRAQPYLYPAFRQGARYLRRELTAWGPSVGAKIRGRARRRRARPT